MQSSSIYKQATSPRIFRVFISSTFRDMQAERDELIKRVFPRLKELCSQRGVIFQEVDLRWGITEADTMQGKVISICLREIDNCRPYFIGLLGERYGWVPDQLPESLLAEHPWLSNYPQKSVTELEILYGVLLPNHQPDLSAFFYFRTPANPRGASDCDSEDAQSKAKLHNLKEMIRCSKLPVQEYKDPVHAGQLVYKDLSALIERFPPESDRSRFGLEERRHQLFAENLARIYMGKLRDFDRLDAYVAGNRPPLAVIGPAGIGKSALLATWVCYRFGLSETTKFSTSRFDRWARFFESLLRRARGQSDQPVDFLFAHFVSATADSTVWSALLHRILTTFKTQFDLELPIPEQPGELRSAFSSCLQTVAQKARVILVIDGLDQLEDREQALDLGWLPENIPANIRLIVSTTDGPTLNEIRRRGWATWKLQPLCIADRHRLIVKYLCQYGKKLNSQQRQEIVTAPQAGNPLFLRTLLEELRIFGHHEKLTAHIKEHAVTESAEALFVKILKRLEQDYKDNRRPDLVEDSLQLLWAARQGLTETELLAMLGTANSSLPSAIWSPLYLAIKELLLRHSELLTFSHRSLRQAVEKRYLVNDKTKQYVHRRLADYFKRQGNHRRKWEELPWHLTALQDWQELYELLADPNYLQAAWPTHQLEIKWYWTKLVENPSFSITTAYEPVLQQPAAYKQCVSAVCRLLGDTGHIDEAFQLSLFLEAEARASNDQERLQASLSLQATFLRERRQYERALELLKIQERICHSLSNETARAASLGNQGAILLEMARLDEAAQYLKEEESICRKIGDLAGLSVNLSNQGIIAFNRNNLDNAFKLFQDQEKLCRQIGDTLGLQKSRNHQAFIYQRRGNSEMALKLHQEAQNTFRQLGDLRALHDCLAGLAYVQQASGAYDQAMDLLDEQERICRQLNDPARLGETLLQAAELFAFCLKQPDYALRRYIKEAQQLAEKYQLNALMAKIEEFFKAIEKLRNNLER